MTQNNACYIKPSSLGTTIIESYPNKKERTISKNQCDFQTVFALSSKIICLDCDHIAVNSTDGSKAVMKLPKRFLIKL